MIPVLPDAQILLDDGSGTYAFDVTDRVRLSSLDVAGHGRSDEFTEANAGTLTVTLDNDDGALTYGAGFGDLPFGFGGFGGAGGAFYPGQGIRYNVTVGATTASRFTGRLTSAELGWEAETGLPSSVVLTAVDPLASLSRRVLRSMLEQEILALSPSFYYPLTEDQGSASAGDLSGNQAPTLTPAGTGVAPAFGFDLGLPGGGSAVAFSGGQYLSGGALSDPKSFCCVFATEASSQQVIIGKESSALTVETDGTLAVFMVDAISLMPVSISGNAIVNDGLPHSAAVVIDGLVARLYVDGTEDATVSLGAGGINPLEVTSVGGGTGLGSVPPLVGAVAQVAGFASVLTPTQVATISAAALSGLAGETTEDRFERLASYAGLATSTTTGMSGQTMGAQDTAGASLLDALQQVAAAEGGVLFADGEGTIVLQGRGYRAGKTTADLTLSADDIDVGTTAPLDDQQIVNQVTVSRTGGATQIYPPDTALTGVELYPASLDLAVDNDGDALRAGQWLVSKHTTAAPRLPSATVDLMRCPQTEQIIAAEIGDRWAIEDMPSQMWDLFGDQTLEGWSETLTIAGDTASWSLTANLLPWSLHTALVLDDPVYGELDAYPLMN